MADDWQARALAAEKLVKELETEIARRDWQAAQSEQRAQAATWPFPQEVGHWRERALKAEARLAVLEAQSAIPAIELLREWYETYGGSTDKKGNPCTPELEQRTEELLRAVDSCTPEKRKA